MGNPAARFCDHCGARATPWKPRTRRPNGELWCDACIHRDNSTLSTQGAAGHHPDIAWKVRTFGVANTSLGRAGYALHRTGATHDEQEARLADTKGWDHSGTGFRPVRFAIEGARSYAHQLHLPDPHATSYEHDHVTPEMVRSRGRAYDSLPEHDPAALPHFEAMRKEVGDQFRHLTHTMGIKVHAVDHDPYDSVRAMAHDVEHNKRLNVLGTHATGGHPIFSNHENDQFRAVHDFFGHAATGRDFSRHGEEAAYHAHAAMFSPHALPALASETRGQNSSLILNGHFGPQKIALMHQQHIAAFPDRRPLPDSYFDPNRTNVRGEPVTPWEKHDKRRYSYSHPSGDIAAEVKRGKGGWNWSATSMHPYCHASERGFVSDKDSHPGAEWAAHEAGHQTWLIEHHLTHEEHGPDTACSKSSTYGMASHRQAAGWSGEDVIRHELGRQKVHQVYVNGTHAGTMCPQHLEMARHRSDFSNQIAHQIGIDARYPTIQTSPPTNGRCDECSKNMDTQNPQLPWERREQAGASPTKEEQVPGQNSLLHRRMRPYVDEVRPFRPGIQSLNRIAMAHRLGDPNKVSSLNPLRIQRVAHDSGDGETIFHCPFCGSGQVIARSDGTVECEFCATAFTVQVQPQMPSFPQTINGSPVDVPGMPAGGQNANVPAGGPDEGFPGADGDPGAEGGPPGEDGDDEEDDSGGNPFAKASFRTATGAVLDAEHYRQHLALIHAEDRNSVLAMIREENGVG